MNRIFLQESCGKWSIEIFPRLFFKIIKQIIFQNEKSWIFIQLVSIVNTSPGLLNYVKTKLRTTCSCHISCVFEKQKGAWNEFPILIFYMVFFIVTKFHCLIVFTSWILVNMYIVLVSFPLCGVIDSEIYRHFLVKMFSHIIGNVRTNIEICWDWNEVSKWNNKHFVFTSKEPSEEQINSPIW